MEVNDNRRLHASNGRRQTVHLKDFSGKPVVLFFYPGDTPGCTIEACVFVTSSRNTAGRAVVLGICATAEGAEEVQREVHLPYTSLQM